MSRLGSGDLTRKNGKRRFLSAKAQRTRECLAPTRLVALDLGAAPRQSGRWCFAETSAVQRGEPAKMAEPVARGDLRYGGAGRSGQQILPHRRQSQPAQILKRGETHERAKMLAQGAFGNAASRGEIGCRNLAAHVSPQVVDGFLQVAGSRPGPRGHDWVE